MNTRDMIYVTMRKNKKRHLRMIPNTTSTTVPIPCFAFTVLPLELNEIKFLNICCVIKNPSTDRQSNLSVDEKELEEIMLREFGPIKRRSYAQPVRIDAEKNYKQIGIVKTNRIIVDVYNVIHLFEDLKTIAEK